MSQITIVLLCHNRPAFAENAINSILNQSKKDFKLVVSDNSTNKELQELMQTRFPQVEYKSWFPGIPYLDHFKEVILLVDTPYFVMFHDDDSMEPEYVSRISEEFEKMPSAAAIGTNAWLMDGNGDMIPNQTVYTGQEKSMEITCEKVFLRQYFASDFGGIMPFCSYSYNTEKVKGIFPKHSMGDNFDTYFLMKVIERGPLVWINEPLVRVRRHEENRSHTSGVNSYKPIVSLGRNLLGSIIRQKHIDEYRFLRLFFVLKSRKKFPVPALKFLILAFPKLMFFSNTFRKRIFKKIFS